jgi:sigma-B regulation protein RsbQ
MRGKFEALHGQIAGEGKTPLILAHGFGMDQTVWAQLRPWFDSRYRVYLYDLAGAGPEGERNYDPHRYGSLFGYADDLLEIVLELGLTRCLYVGHSVSGMIGAAAAVARPDLFDRLVMIGASPRYLNDGTYHGGFEQRDLDGLYDAMATNFQAWAAGFLPLVVGVPDNRAVDEFSRMLFQMRPDIALTTARTIWQSDMRDIARRLERPTHLVQTRNDLAVPHGVAEWLNANIDRSTLDVIEAEGHVPHLTAPDEIVRVLKQHLAPGLN